jgi:hypothetical protein
MYFVLVKYKMTRRNTQSYCTTFSVITSIYLPKRSRISIITQVNIRETEKNDKSVYEFTGKEAESAHARAIFTAKVYYLQRKSEISLSLGLFINK